MVDPQLTQALQLAQGQEQGVLGRLGAEEEVQLGHWVRYTRAEEVQKMARQAAGTKRPLKDVGVGTGWQRI